MFESKCRGLVSGWCIHRSEGAGSSEEAVTEAHVSSHKLLGSGTRLRAAVLLVSSEQLCMVLEFSGNSQEQELISVLPEMAAHRSLGRITDLLGTISEVGPVL